MPEGLALKTLDRDSENFLESLIQLFYRDSNQLGGFALAKTTDVPQPYAMLLAHNRHMTVTVEAFHRDAVDVQVLRSLRHEDTYSREILLKVQHTGQVVQFGIVKIHLNRIADKPKGEILEERKPLGRVLIENQVLREVELFSLWRVRCGPSLAQFFSVEPDSVTFGRTAVIHCDGEPAIELLEIVRPVVVSLGQ